MSSGLSSQNELHKCSSFIMDLDSFVHLEFKLDSETGRLQLYSISHSCLELLAVLGGDGRDGQVRGEVRVRELPFNEDLIRQSPQDSSYHGSHQRHPEPVIVTPDKRIEGVMPKYI